MKTKIFEIEIIQRVSLGQLAEVPHEELDQAEDSGGLVINHMYEDLRFMTWEDAANAIAIEKIVLGRLEAAADALVELHKFNDERIHEDEQSLALWGLDVGVAAATIALSAFGAAPIGSCNGGAFGDFHQGSHPYVAFYMPKELAGDLLSVVAAVQVGLVSSDDGIARIFSRRIEDMTKFAEVLYERCHYR